ncbi:hypothetical protein Tco_0196794 [Tanacetum coccineum]
MSRFVCLDELVMAANSMVMANQMLVHCERETTRDIKVAKDMSKSLEELLNGVNERQLGGVEGDGIKEDGCGVASLHKKADFVDEESVIGLWSGEWVGVFCVLSWDEDDV